MTKYIDLLREHQQEPKKTKKGKKSKRAKASASEQNPYSAKQATDETSLENMEALIEEQEKDVAQQDIIIEESISPKSDNQHSQAENMPSPTQKMTADYGFDISAWLNNINQTLLRMFTAVQNDETINLDMLHEQLSTLFDQVQTSPKLLDVLELEINSQHKRNSGTHAHADLAQKSIMMMLYSIKVGMQFKLQWEELLPIVVAAMLHHLGMAFVPSHIRQKPEKLTNEEFEHIKQASKHALEYLEKHHINHEQLYLAISQGNERYDGSGPQELEGHDIAWVARLVSLLSTFEAMIHFRPYRQRLLPLDAIREIVKNHKKEFDPELLKALIDSISLYPVGTFVQLNTGEIGQVTTVHPKFPLRPVVYINMNKHGHAISQREIDLKKQPNLMIQKCMYEESIQELTEEQTSS